MNNKKNILGINNPDECYCRIWRYHSGHSRLLLIIDREKLNESPIYVIFENVMYFEGPIIWAGGNFWVGEPDETTEIFFKIRLSGVEDQRVQQSYLEKYRLFVGGVSDSKVIKILASTYRVEYDTPKIDFPDL